MNKKKIGHAKKVLLVEDDQGDIDLTLEAMKKSNIMIDLTIVNDGVEAMEFLHKKGKFVHEKNPDLILLDLNMPRKNGNETLEEIKTNNNLKHIPVIVLTTSDSDEDVIKSYAQGACCFVTKPVSLIEFEKVIQAIDNFWFSVVRYP